MVYMLKYALLGFLNYLPMTGYELKRYYDVSANYLWHAKLSQIYTTLKKMEEQGLLTSEVVAQESRPDRRVYTITEEGRAELRQWLAEPMTRLHVHKEPLLLKFFFSAQLESEVLMTELHLQRKMREKQVARYYEEIPRAIQEVVDDYPQLEKDALFWRATLRYGQMFAEMNLQWLNETILMIEEQFQ